MPVANKGKNVPAAAFERRAASNVCLRADFSPPESVRGCLWMAAGTGVRVSCQQDPTRRAERMARDSLLSVK